MDLTKDTYEYLLNFADDREVLHMLSVNKKFRNEELFEKIVKRRYPLVSRFKKDKSWKEFYIQTIYYLSKLKEKFEIPYIPTLDFEPEVIYKSAKSPNHLHLIYPIESITEILQKQNVGNIYHTIASLKNDKYVIETNLRKGESMANLGFREEPQDEIILDLAVKKESDWLAFIAENNSNLYSEVFQNRQDAINYLYREYLNIVNEFIDSILDNLNVPATRGEVIQQDAGLTLDWEDREKFIAKISDGITLKMDDYYPNKDITRYDFQLVQIHI